MNSGTRRSDEVFTEWGALVVAGVETLAGAVCAAVLLRVADGPGRVGPVMVEDEGACVDEPVEVVGTRNVGTVAPAQPAKTKASAVAPTGKPLAYLRACLT
jgi:hypothetical protein